MQKALKGKNVIFVYDSLGKIDMVEEVFVNTKISCRRFYAEDVEHAERIFEVLKRKGVAPDLLVTDFCLTQDEDMPMENGGVLYERLRAGAYEKHLPGCSKIPVIFDSGAQEPEIYRNEPRVYLRKAGSSLVEICAVAMRAEKDVPVPGDINRKPSYYGSHDGRFMDHHGRIEDDSAAMKHARHVRDVRDKEIYGGKG